MFCYSDEFKGLNLCKSLEEEKKEADELFLIRCIVNLIYSF
jgi:hypothetical protein